ncbi:hypothetical protein L207DRAFT_217562 [Hyaloscypha variabilis F]|jgi:hypothetical protein|uniref:Uncharacterized protein n=1 Tax=Hyaloscypha variabilis (strain UAMH 11265 / GT02V1 / F) TaxID=1149755 RepID=A0A2J6S777_HYAVF|nr:hypothetical protein L207DRAFT_217562 [Hyaloscypha variabilis F]
MQIIRKRFRTIKLTTPTPAEATRCTVQHKPDTNQQTKHPLIFFSCSQSLQHQIKTPQTPQLLSRTRTQQGYLIFRPQLGDSHLCFLHWSLIWGDAGLNGMRCGGMLFRLEGTPPRVITRLEGEQGISPGAEGCECRVTTYGIETRYLVLWKCRSGRVCISLTGGRRQEAFAESLWVSYFDHEVRLVKELVFSLV